MFALNLIMQDDVWDKKIERKNKFCRHKEQEYFVNMIDMAQNVENIVPQEIIS